MKRVRSGTGERGSVTLWMLGLGITLLMVGGIALDLWRLVGVRREMSAMADAAAVAAASAVDTAAWRAGREVVVDPAGAEERARAVLAAQPLAESVTLPAGWLAVDAAGVEVSLDADVELTLLRLVHPGPVDVRVTARAAASLRD